MRGDDALQVAFREIRHSYHSAVTEWAFGDKVAMVKELSEAEKRTRALIDLVESERDNTLWQTIKKPI